MCFMRYPQPLDLGQQLRVADVASEERDGGVAAEPAGRVLQQREQ
jgi:hypothetical protein